MDGQRFIFEVGGVRKEYIEADRGRFDSALLRNGKRIAYTDGDIVIIEDLSERQVVEAWAKFYDLMVFELEK